MQGGWTQGEHEGLLNGRDIAKSPRQLERGELHSERIPEKCREFPLSIQQDTTWSQGKNYPKGLKEEIFSIPGNSAWSYKSD